MSLLRRDHRQAATVGATGVAQPRVTEAPAAATPASVSPLRISAEPVSEIDDMSTTRLGRTLPARTPPK